MAIDEQAQLQRRMTAEEQQLVQAYSLADNVLMKRYLLELGTYGVMPLDNKASKFGINDVARFYHLDRIICDKEENNQEKLLNVYNALYTCGGSVILLLRSDGEKIDFYIGTKAKDRTRIGVCQNVLDKALGGNFKGTQLSPVFGGHMTELIDKMFPKSTNGISAVTSIASFREGHTMKSGEFVQGLEKLLETTYGEKFTLMILAHPVSPKELESVRRLYEALYSQLRPFSETEITYGESGSEAVTNSVTEGVSVGVTTNTTKTTTKSESTGVTESESDTTGTSDTTGNTYSIGVGAGLGAAVNAAVTAAMTLGTGGLAGLLVQASGTLSGTLGAALNASLNANLGYSRSNSHTESQSRTVGKSISRNTTTSIGVSTGRSDSNTQSRTFGQSITSTDGQNVSYMTHLERRNVKTLLDQIEIQLERINECADLGMWDSAAYVLADDAQTSQVVASSYQALIRGKNSGVENSAITVWNINAADNVPVIDENLPFAERQRLRKLANKHQNVIEYLKRMEHPLLRADEDSPIVVTPAAMISGEELTVAAGLPQQSLPGLPVDNIAKFGREVTYQKAQPARTLPFGKIHHMGQVEKTDVKLDIDLLTSHAFVTGSTGSGKSNSVYKLLQELKLRRIPWLVIEPAKGEYKDVFGGASDVNVYGTNPYKVPNLLQLNPFSFPDDVHVLEHVDRLVEIFNACWPMYAAMPAILRESIERAYEACGWSLKFSKNPGQFPTFDTLINILPQVIDSSAYSSDTSSDYKGALVTRVRSLTRGIHGMIFGSDLDMKTLLEAPSIIDLSRIGSQETKSLIMGVLVLKLQEYRMSEDVDANSGLRHITVLEEAHNLLRRTSTEQSQEGSNLQGQSVAMISNAIAEMRTYGEGFVIADQSPALMDMSVIRNTNTKIILRLPDENDRQLVGKATGLSDVQIEELSGLDTGVAAIFQSIWTEPVLSKIDKFDREQSFKARYGNKVFEWHDAQSSAIKKFLNNALDVERSELSSDERREVRKWYGQLGLSEKATYIFEHVLENHRLPDDHKIILLNAALEHVINNNPLRAEAIEAARNMLIARFDIDRHAEILRSVEELFRNNLPESFVAPSAVEHVR